MNRLYLAIDFTTHANQSMTRRDSTQHNRPTFHAPDPEDERRLPPRHLLLEAALVEALGKQRAHPAAPAAARAFARATPGCGLGGLLGFVLIVGLLGGFGGFVGLSFGGV
jgi:hypothetical protein